MKFEASKLKGNCVYGRAILDKSKHTKLSFAKPSETCQYPVSQRNRTPAMKTRHANHYTIGQITGSPQMIKNLNEHFLNVLNTQKPHLVENAGFVKDSIGIIKTHT